MELMVVVGIMAFLGLAATNGYNALQRGIAERGAVDAASALLRAAKERACVDRVPTAVFFYNRMIRGAQGANGEEVNAIVVGEAVAVRRAGRITYAESGYLADEFGDFGNYDVVDSGALQSRRSMRLWRINDVGEDLDYAYVSDAVCRLDLPNAYSFMPWADGAVGQSNYVIQAEAFLKKSGIDFKVGDGYGFEFQTLRLPDGFIFEKTMPSKVGVIERVKTVFFRPTDHSSDKEVDVNACRIDASGMPKYDHRAGTATSEEGKER